MPFCTGQVLRVHQNPPLGKRNTRTLSKNRKRVHLCLCTETCVYIRVSLIFQMTDYIGICCECFFVPITAICNGPLQYIMMAFPISIRAGIFIIPWATISPRPLQHVISSACAVCLTQGLPTNQDDHYLQHDNRSMHHKGNHSLRPTLSNQDSHSPQHLCKRVRPKGSHFKYQDVHS